MEKLNINERVNVMRDNAQKEKQRGKICPFRDIECNSRCKLYRDNNRGFECPFQEIPSMSWNLKDLIKKIIGK